MVLRPGFIVDLASVKKGSAQSVWDPYVQKWNFRDPRSRIGVVPVRCTPLASSISPARLVGFVLSLSARLTHGGCDARKQTASR
jgi:hypothetical protein